MVAEVFMKTTKNTDLHFVESAEHEIYILHWPECQEPLGAIISMQIHAGGNVTSLRNLKKKTISLAGLTPWLHRRNSQSFEGVQIQSFQTSAQVSSLLKYFRENSRSTAPKVIGELLIDKCRCWSFFDGARQGPDQASVIGGILYFSDVYYISYKANCSQGTNNLAVLAWRTLLKLVLDEGLCDLHVYGYSSSVVNWMLGTQALKNTSLQNIGSHVKEIAGAFNTLQDLPCFSQIKSNCRHTFKERYTFMSRHYSLSEFQGGSKSGEQVFL